MNERPSSSVKRMVKSCLDCKSLPSPFSLSIIFHFPFRLLLFLLILLFVDLMASPFARYHAKSRCQYGPKKGMSSPFRAICSHGETSRFTLSSYVFAPICNGMTSSLITNENFQVSVCPFYIHLLYINLPFFVFVLSLSQDEWEESENYTSQPSGFWSVNKRNMRLFLEDFARQRNLNPLTPATWYSIPWKSIAESQVSSFPTPLSYFLLLSHYLFEIILSSD